MIEGKEEKFCCHRTTRTNLFFNHSLNAFNEIVRIDINFIETMVETIFYVERIGRREGRDVKIFQSYFAVTKNYRSKFFAHRVALIEPSGAEYKIIREIS